MNRIKNLQPKLSRASTRRGEPREKNASCLYLKYNRTQTLFSALCLFARLLYALLIALLISLFGLHLKKQKMIWLADTKTWWLKMRAKRGSYFEYLHNENCFFWWFSALPLGDMSLCVIDAYRISDRKSTANIEVYYIVTLIFPILQQASFKQAVEKIIKSFMTTPLTTTSVVMSSNTVLKIPSKMSHFLFSFWAWFIEFWRQIFIKTFVRKRIVAKWDFFGFFSNTVLQSKTFLSAF